MSQARMPTDRIAQRVWMMRKGDSGFINEDGLFIDNENRCWLRHDYYLYKTPNATADMRIAYCEDGFHVWSRQDRTFESVKWGTTHELAVAVLHWES